MRFKKGTKVEVFSKKDVSTGAWYCAEVISGNGHTYSVKYGWFPATNEAVAERVPRKAIRPCPPPVQGMDAWVPGNLVEVFHNLAWKTATILKVIDANYFLVRVFGSSKDSLIHKAHLRVRQCWQDDKWFVIGKGSKPVGKRQQVHDDTSPVKKRIQIPRCSMGSSRTLKRKLPILHPVAAAQKNRLVENDGSHQRICFVNQSPNFEKVDAIVYPNEILGEKHVHFSSSISTTEYSRMDESRATNSSLVESSLAVHTDDDCASSVASSSSMCHGGCTSSFSLSRQHCNNLEDYVSDAESTSGDGNENEGHLVSADEQFGVESHRSEFLRYCSAMEDLYDSGPLSWEDEVNLTNLRQMLHISDDEHLMVLRNLIPANSTLLFSSLTDY